VLFNILLIKLNRKKVCVVFYIFNVSPFTVLDRVIQLILNVPCIRGKKKRMRHYNKTCKIYCLLSLLVCFITLVCSRSHEHQQRRV